jgi:succinate-semialdehyde dehydrogenase / glutarate-semialdehyde dehydrogenase
VEFRLTVTPFRCLFEAVGSKTRLFELKRPPRAWVVSVAMNARDSRRHPPCVSLNSTTGEILREFEPHSDAEVENRLQLAVVAFGAFRASPLDSRAGILMRAAELLEAEKERLGRLMTLEMGKLVRAAVQEAEKCAAGCRYYARNAAAFLADEPAPTPGRHSFVRHEPLGLVLAVMPWNFPFWQVVRFAAPALMAGNVVLLKHASNVPQCALAIEDLFARAGVPRGAFQTLLIGSDRVAALIRDPRVRAVTLTGSVGAGSQVAAVAGQQIKKTVLELGGSDPFIVMPSADLEEAVTAAVKARTINNGQSCIAAKRFIVEERVAEEFTARFVRAMAELKVGDPLEPDTDLGPLATEEVIAGLQKQVDRTVQLGARLLLGGKRLDGPGFFFPPTVLTDIPPNSPVANDELFGPVASLFSAQGLEEAIRMANDTPFGLGASVWTQDAAEREAFTDRLEAGMVFFNEIVASEPRLPFGGVKQSGYGRELSHHGIREFVNIKTVVVRESAPGRTETE